MTTRIEGTVTSISWIPSEAVTGMATKLPFSTGVAHYDTAPPDQLGAPADEALEALRTADRFRFANQLTAFIEVDDAGGVSSCGYLGGGRIGATTLKLGVTGTVAAVAMTDRQLEPEMGDGWVRFVQSAGGRTGVPAPRTVRHPPFVQFNAPTAWTTLALVIHTDGRVEHELVGASPFPRHWIYGGDGALSAKTGLIDFKDWYKRAFGKHTPWGDVDSPALATEVETALERELAEVVMRGSAKPKVRKVKKTKTIVEQGQPGDEIFLLLDGVVAVEIDGEPIVEIGPGAVLGERAVIEGGNRTSTLRAVTACKLACVSASQIDPTQLAGLAEGHRREHRAD